MSADILDPAAAPVRPAVAKPRRRRAGHGTRGALDAGWPTYTVLAVVTILAVFPLYYTVVEASHTNAEMAQNPPPFLPSSSLWHNIHTALQIAPLNKGLINSLIVAGCITAGTVAFCTLAGFAFAKLRFRGSSLLFAICVGTMMVPTQMGIVPLYILMARWGMVGHLSSVILPTLVGAFGVFFMRQYILSAVPDELIEAAHMDGASTTRVFLSIVVPAVRPAMAVLGMLTFLQAWNDFFWPMITLNTQNPTVQVSFASLAQGIVPQQSVIMAGTIYGTVPVLIVFAILGRQIVGGIMQGAVKG